MHFNTRALKKIIVNNSSWSNTSVHMMLSSDLSQVILRGAW